MLIVLHVTLAQLSVPVFNCDEASRMLIGSPLW